MEPEMTEHTPGPWQWCHPDASASILYGADDDPMCTGILIALGHEGCAERQGRNCAITNRPSRDADLALIAAVPDLLAACKMLLERQAALMSLCDHDEGVEVLTAVRKAIAKAERRDGR
jgi:hypothetical protein